jgi:hypothetical protein
MWNGCVPRACKSALTRLKIVGDTRLSAVDDGQITNETKDVKAGDKGMKDAKSVQ